MSDPASDGGLNLDAAVRRLQENPRERVLVVGGMAGNFSQLLRKHHRMIFWDSTDPRTRRQRGLPPRVGVVVFFRWIDHGLAGSLRDQGRRRSVTIVDAFGRTGEFEQKICEFLFPAPMGQTMSVTPPPRAPLDSLDSLGPVVPKKWDPECEELRRMCEDEMVQAKALADALHEQVRGLQQTVDGLRGELTAKAHEGEREKEALRNLNARQIQEIADLHDRIGKNDTEFQEIGDAFAATLEELKALKKRKR